MALRQLAVETVAMAVLLVAVALAEPHRVAVVVAQAEAVGFKLAVVVLVAEWLSATCKSRSPAVHRLVLIPANRLPVPSQVLRANPV